MTETSGPFSSISFSFLFFAKSVCTPTWDFCIYEDTTVTLNHSRSSNLLFCVLADTTSVPVLGPQANLKESLKSKELYDLRLQVLLVVKANDACESKKEIIRLRE